MGSPARPDTAQYAELERAGQLALAGSPEWLTAKQGAITLRFDLPRQGVSLLEIRW
jgi:xylan 1,4-beta-xylosidase